jgi:hypothetical protein
MKANIGSYVRGEIALFLIGIVYVLEKATTRGAWQGKLFSERSAADACKKVFIGKSIILKNTR